MPDYPGTTPHGPSVQSPTQLVQHIIGAPTNDVVATIDRVAVNVGVPTALAEAVAKVESGFNPNIIGDHGTSFGLYQLHRGGELGNLTPAQAFVPATNARVSLSHLATVLGQHPEYSPGQAAAAAQRPADPTGYAQKIDAILAAGVTTGPAPIGTTATPVDVRIPGTPWHVPTPNDIAKGAGNAAGAIGGVGVDAAKAVLSWLAKPLELVALVGIGLIIIVVGLVVLAKAAGNSVEVRPAAAGGGRSIAGDAEAAAGA